MRSPRKENNRGPVTKEALEFVNKRARNKRDGLSLKEALLPRPAGPAAKSEETVIGQQISQFAVSGCALPPQGAPVKEKC